MLPHRTMRSHSLVPPRHTSLGGRGEESCLLDTRLVRESARVHFKELRDGLPVTETQKELVPDPSPRKTKRTVDRGLTPAYKKKGEGGGDCFDSKGRSARPHGGICNPAFISASRRLGSMCFMSAKSGSFRTARHTGISFFFF